MANLNSENPHVGRKFQEFVQTILKEKYNMYDGKIPLMVQERANWPKKIGRNDPCPCGSGKKYKFCHGKN